MITYPQFLENLEGLKVKIATYALNCGRAPQTIQIIPVTKYFPLLAVQYAVQAGFQTIGENHVQEALQKKEQADRDNLHVHFELIGHLQSNKAKQALLCFDRIQTVDSEQLIIRLDRLAQECGKRLPILLQVNTANDSGKSGFASQAAFSAVECALKATHLKLEGFMTIGPLTDDAHKTGARRAFQALRYLRDQAQTHFEVSLPELSMGMSEDYPIAIEEGSTLIRIGSGLYGKRL